jgi:hypothetical protein
MKLLTQDGRVFVGTAAQILLQMRDISFTAADLTLGQYIDWVIENTRRYEGVDLVAAGDTDEARARALVDALVAAGLAQRG